VRKREGRMGNHRAETIQGMGRQERGCQTRSEAGSFQFIMGRILCRMGGMLIFNGRAQCKIRSTKSEIRNKSE
jgi:hypothetical protein